MEKVVFLLSGIRFCRTRRGAEIDKIKNRIKKLKSRRCKK